MLGYLSVPGRPTNLDDSRARAYCACSRCGWGCLDIFSLIYLFSFLSPSLWETARYRLKYCLKGPLNLNQPTNHLLNINVASSFYVCLRNFTVTEVLNKPHDRKSQYKFAHNSISSQYLFLDLVGWSGGAMALGKLPVPGRPTMWIRVGQGPTALVVGAGGGCLDIFFLIYPFFYLSPCLWETARYRLKYCLKGPLNPKQPTNQHNGSAQKSTSGFSWTEEDSKESSGTEADRGKVDEPTSTSGIIDATAACVSGSETAGVRAICGVSVGGESGLVEATPEVEP